MMIARVRIAPLENWCEFHAKHFKIPERLAICKSLVGMEVEIVTDTMRMSVTPECLGKLWDITQSTDDLFTAKGCQRSGQGICEHMLEMD